MKLKYYLLALVLVFLFSCSKDDSDPGTPIDPNPIDTTIVDTTGMIDEYMGEIPIIMLHGTLGSGDTYATQFYRFLDNGYTKDELFAFDWDGASFGSRPIDDLDSFVDEILNKTGAPKVNLVGHSAGGGFCFDYMSDLAFAEKVSKYVHIAGTNIDGLPQNQDGTIPTLNLYSDADMTVAGSDIDGAVNLKFDDFDHYEIATSSESFVAMYKFFNDENEPAHLNFLEQDEILLSGKVLTLGDNSPNENILIEIYALNDQTGIRNSQTADAEYVSSGDGSWGPFQAEKDTKYEFVISNSLDSGFKTVHYYREGFVHSDNLVYLRSFPPPGSIAGFLLGGLPNDDNQSVISIFSSSKAIIADRDELFFDGQLLSTANLASADQTTIALFLYDDGDSMSSGDSHGNFAAVPFLNGADYYTNTSQVAHLPVTLNDKQLFVKNWKSESEGYSVLVFN